MLSLVSDWNSNNRFNFIGVKSVEEIKVIVKAEQRNQIIRAVNYSIMKLDEMRKEAIRQNITIGELYIRMERDKMNKDEKML